MIDTCVRAPPMRLQRSESPGRGRCAQPMRPDGAQAERAHTRPPTCGPHTSTGAPSSRGSGGPIIMWVPDLGLALRGCP
eukprot:2506816-Prymnesium_polylepis.2